MRPKHLTEKPDTHIFACQNIAPQDYAFLMRSSAKNDYRITEIASRRRASDAFAVFIETSWSEKELRQFMLACNYPGSIAITDLTEEWRNG